MDNYAALEELLTRIVEAAGSRAGVLSTWDAAHPERAPQTTRYNLDETTAQTVGELMERTGGRAGRDTLARLEEDARRAGLPALALPVRFHDRLVGLLCLLHPDDASALLSDSPGTYNLRIDQVVQSARLLQRLLRERRWLEAAVHHTTQGIFILDQDGNVVGFNVAMERLSGWTLDEAVGRPGHEMFPIRAVSSSLTLAGDSGGDPVEARLRTRDAVEVEVEAASTVLRDESGGLLGWVVTVRDLRAQKEKERLERVFLSGVSHDLQTPIAIIKGFSGLLSDEEVALSPEQVREKAAIIHDESRRLETMVRQMLFATSLQAGAIRLELEPVAVDALVRRVAHKMEPLLQERGCALSLRLPRRLEPVPADPARLEQVVSNLLENALKYAGDAADKGIEVAVEGRRSEVEVAVSDAGPGVPSVDRRRIFEPFERSGSAAGQRGTGLGLFICKSIVEAHGGRIGVESAPTGGARFFFTLPRRRAALARVAS